MRSAVLGDNRGTLPLTSPLRCEEPEKLKEYASMQYRYEIEHAPANLALQGEGPEKLKEHAPMQYSIKSGHAPANFAFVAVLTSSFALLAFSKY